MNDLLQTNPVIASISGGKDSTAMLLYLIENNIKFTPVFCDTGWEHPLTYDHLEYLEAMLNIKITRLRNEKYFQTEGGGLEELIRKRKYFPPQQNRSCTMHLKVVPIQEYLDKIRSEFKKKPINVVGIRHAESKARSVLDEWENKDESYIFRPLIHWSTEQVIEIHQKYGIQPNPLYLKGFTRVGCFPCIFSRKAEIKNAHRVLPSRFDLIRQLENEVHAHILEKNPETKTLYSFFNRGKIDEVLDWAYGEQLDLFEEDESFQGCLSWGLCDNSK